MKDWLIALLPLLTSTAGIGLISKIAIGILKKVAKKNDDKVKLLQNQNERLENENVALKEQLAKNETFLKECLIETKAEVNEIKSSIIESKNTNEELNKLVNQATTIRNELRTLLEAKKE